MFKGRGEMVRGKADSITRAIDPPYPSSKPYQKEKQVHLTSNLWLSSYLLDVLRISQHCSFVGRQRMVPTRVPHAGSPSGLQDSHTVRMKMRAKTFQNPKFQSIYLSDYRPASQESRPATPHLRTVASFRTLTPDGSEKSSWRRRRTSNTGTNNSLVSPRGALAPSGGLTRGGRSPEPGRSPEDVQSLYADLRERAKSVSGLTSSKPSMGISPEELECLGQLANRTRSERANRLQAANTGASPSSGNLQGIRQLTQKPRGSMAVEVPAGEVAPWGSGAEASRPVTAGSARPTVQLRWSLGPLDGSFEEFDQGGCGCSSAANSPDASQQIRTCSDEIQRAQASPQPCSPSRLSTASLGDTSVNPMGPLLLPDLGRLETHIGEVCPSSSSSRSASPPALSSIPAALVDVGLHAGKVLHVPAPPPYSRDYFATDPGERERIRSQAAGLSNVPWSPTGLPKAPLTRRVAHVKPRPPQGMPRPSPGRPGPAAGAKSRRLFAKAGHRASSSPGTKTTEVGVGQMQPPGQQDGDDWEPMIHWESGVPPGLQKERQISGARLRVGSPVRDSGRGVVNPDVPAINKYPFLSVREHLAKQVHGAKSLKELETLGRTAATYSRKRYQSAPASRRSCREELSGTPMEEGSTSRPVSRGSLSPVSRSSSPQVSRHACDQRPASPGIWTIFFKDDEGPDQKRTIRVYPTTKQMTRPSAAMAMSPTRVRSRDHTHPIRSG